MDLHSNMNKSCCHLIGSSWPMHAPSSEAKLQETRRRSDMSDASLTKTPQWFPMLVVCWATTGDTQCQAGWFWLILHWRARLQCRHQQQRKGVAESTGTDVQSSVETGWKVGRFFESRILWESGSPIYSQICPWFFFSGLLHSKRILTFVVLSATTGFAWYFHDSGL